jgi:murein DD-endopeptidase MepM/ murein hydrolase activator NlpD
LPAKETIVARFCFSILLLPWAMLSLAAAAPPEPTAKPLLRAVDLNCGESAEVELCDGTKVRVKLLDLRETADSLRLAVRDARVQVEIDGRTTWLTSAQYQLPITLGKAQIDCPITKGTTANSSSDAWGLEKDARLRLWPAGSPLVRAGTFVYPVKQRWLANSTQMANEPCYVNAGDDPQVRKIYYHYGLDFGGTEGMTQAVAATDGLVVSAGKETLPGYKDTPVAPRYDVVYLLDDQGWYYRYSHFDSIDPAIKAGGRVQAGQRLGLVGKEGGSGGWTHLHFDIFCRQPSGKWGCQEAYAFAWEAYRKQCDPRLVAVARPHHLAAAGEKITLDGGKSWSAYGKIVSYQWTFTDGTTADGPRIERTYKQPGYYSEVLKVSDAAGRVAYDFAVVVVADRQQHAKMPPAVHVVCEPSMNVRPGDEVTFKVRTFRVSEGEETWDFGDGSPKRKSRSNLSPAEHAKDGYATLTHRYERPGQYLVRVERADAEGRPAIGYVCVPVEK